MREFELSDFDDVHEYAKNADVMQYQNWGPNSKSDTIKFIQECITQIHHQPRLQFNFAIELKETQKLIGSCAVFRDANELCKANIGYIINPSYWLQGFATEAVRAMLLFIKSEFQISDIRATCDRRNLASIQLLKKLNFELVEKIINDYQQKGLWRDTLVYQLRNSLPPLSR